MAVARAMIHRPRIIFADEPTGLLDRATGLEAMALLCSYCTPGSLVAVTLNPELMHGADQVITMRDGRFVDAEIVHPANLDIPHMADVSGGRVRYTEN